MNKLDVYEFAGQHLSWAYLFPIVAFALLLKFFLYYGKVSAPLPGSTEWIDREVEKTQLTFFNMRCPLTKSDIAPIIIITAVFGFLSLFTLGDLRASQSFLQFGDWRSVASIELDKPTEIGISLFGMMPFGWRVMGAIFGTLMLPIMYIFVKNMFGKTIVAACATMVFGFDFMRFVQARISAIDIYAVFFILLAYFFMYWYITTPSDARFRKSLLPLALSGIAFGLGCAAKWVTIYAGVGLALIYLIRLIQHVNYYKSENPQGLRKYMIKTLLFFGLFFVIAPAVIYTLSYIPLGSAMGLEFSAAALLNPEFYSSFFTFIWDNQVFMFNYHSTLAATHPSSSVWWQWIINSHPMLYFNSSFEGLRSSFAAFGNPAVWWGGFVAMVFMAYRVCKRKDGIALFIVIGFLSQLVPWIPVTQTVSITHYFPSTLFLILAIAHVLNTLEQRKRDGYRTAIYGYTAGTGLLFGLFYPALTGIAVPQWYFTHLLRWFPVGWPF